MIKPISIRYLLILALGLSNRTNAQELIIDLKEINVLLENWTEAHNTKNLHKLASLYAPDVIFYAQSLLKENCIEVKSKTFQSNRHFHQEIINQPTVTVYSSGIIKVSFTNRIESGTITTEYDTYLLLKKFNPALLTSKLLIVGESDLITDANAQFTPSLGKELKQSRLSKATPDYESTNNDNIPPSRFPIYLLFAALAILSVTVIGFIGYKRTKRGSTLSKSPPSAFNQKSRSEKIGHVFEEFIVHRFSTKYFTILEWRSDKISRGIYPKSSLYPDLEIQFQFGDVTRTFAIECKYRSSLSNGEFKLDKKQLGNYNEFRRLKDMSVYIALGLGGNPEAPRELYIIPLSSFDIDGVVRHDTILNFYNNPYAKFYYNIQAGGLSYFRKTSND